jgi:hypothetical protein
MSRPELIKLLLDDFLKMFPTANETTRKTLLDRLSMMQVEDLELLLKGVKPC